MKTSVNLIRKSIAFIAFISTSSVLLGMDTPLMIACQRPDWQSVKTMLMAKPPVNHADEFGITALHYAVRSAQTGDLDALSAIEAMIDAGANIDALNNHGLTPLMLAILLKKLPVVQLLIKKGANPDLIPQGNFANTLSARRLARAIVSQNAASNKENMMASMDIFNAIDPFNPGAGIEQAAVAIKGAAPAAGAGAEIYAKETDPLNTKANQSLATTYGRQKLLLEQRPLYGPYHGKGKVYTSQELMQALKSKVLDPNLMYANNDTPPIVTAAEHDDRAVIQCLIDNGYLYINKADAKGETALHKAALADNMLLTHYLLMIGLDIDCPDNEGNTPLMAAVQKTKKDVALLLLCSGADATKCNKKKESLLKQAVDTEEPYMVALLLEQKNIPLDKKTLGKTPFEWAQYKFKNLSAQAITQGKGERIHQIVILFENHMTRMSDVVKTQLEKEEQAAADQEQAAKAKKQAAQDEKAWIAWAKQRGRPKLHVILSARCGLTLDRKAGKDSARYMNRDHDNKTTLKILTIIDETLGILDTTTKKEIAK